MAAGHWQQRRTTRLAVALVTLAMVLAAVSPVVLALHGIGGDGFEHANSAGSDGGLGGALGGTHVDEHLGLADLVRRGLVDLTQRRGNAGRPEAPVTARPEARGGRSSAEFGRSLRLRQHRSRSAAAAADHP
ncbi:hypothetical protein [Amycolatopsis sp. NPDC051102]|uniref:hypothetical protein n=1 Tax=Amycolatopsis sp. NPDC051102 TaxID=3155163 RepID=UPI0034448D93